MSTASLMFPWKDSPLVRAEPGSRVKHVSSGPKWAPARNVKPYQTQNHMDSSESKKAHKHELHRGYSWKLTPLTSHTRAGNTQFNLMACLCLFLWFAFSNTALPIHHQNQSLSNLTQCIRHRYCVLNSFKP